MARFGRRRFLALGLAAAVAGQIRPALAGAPLGGLAGPANDTERRLAGLFRNPEFAREVGRKYLAIHPDEADRYRLRTTLFGVARPRSSAALRNVLADRRRKDFEDGDIAVVDGWVLARSEARVCALVALTPS